MIHFRTTTLQMSDTETEDKRSPGSKSDADGALESNTDKESTINGEAKKKVDVPCEEVCEIIDEESNISQSGDVITVEDTGENALPSKTIPDAVFFDSVSEEEKQYYEDNSLSQAKLETFNVRCTACWKQVNHHVMNSVMRHPVLGVAICRYCRDFYEGDGTEDGWEKDEEGLDLYYVATLAVTIIVILAFYVYLYLCVGLFVTSGDENSQNTYYGPRMINTRFVGYIAGSIALIRQPYDHLCLHFWLPIHSEIS